VHTQTLFEQVCPGTHVPQSSTLPHPSERSPQVAPADAQEIGVHQQVFDSQV
jgi:hypothetical protein